MTEFYQWIFSEASRAVFIPGIRELTFPAMQLFGGYDVALPLAVAMLAAGIGALPVWLLGRVMGKLRTLRPESLPEEKFQLISAKARQFGWLALPLYALLPMGSLLILIAGFFRMPVWMVAVAVAAGRALVFTVRGM